MLEFAKVSLVSLSNKARKGNQRLEELEVKSLDVRNNHHTDITHNILYINIHS